MVTSLRRRMLRRDCLTGSVSPSCILLCVLLLLCVWCYFVDVTFEYRSLSGPRSYPTPASSRDSTLGREGYHKSIHGKGAKIRVDETVQWQVTDGFDLLYLYNAYYDDVEQPEVRLVAMGDEKHIKRWQRVFCHFWSQSNQLPTKVVGYLDHIPDAHSMRYTGMFAHCPIKDGTKPTEVSVTFNDTNVIYNKFPIRYPHRRSPKIPFTVCYCLLHSNFSRYETLVQSLEMDQLLGASRAVVYLHGAFPALAPVLRHYQARGFLEVVQWRVPDIRHIHYFAQIPAMNDCLYRNLHQSQYLIYHDMDEVLLPLQHRSWHQLLDHLTSAFPDGAAFGFRCSYVNDLFPETPEHLPRDLASPAKRLGLSFLLRTRRENFVYADKWRSKMVIIPERVATTGIHCIWRARKNTKEHFMDPALGLNFHFRSKWVLNDTIDDTSLTDRFASELVSNVQRVLEELVLSGSF